MHIKLIDPNKCHVFNVRNIIKKLFIILIVIITLYYKIGELHIEE